MEILLVKAIMENIKAIEKSVLDFSRVTNIYGGNGTGKSAACDLIFWNLLSKNYEGKKDFSIRPYNEVSEIIYGTNPSVTLLLKVDGELIELKRVLKEKVGKKKGEINEKIIGNTTDFYINGIKVTEKEYQSKIGNIIDEGLLKILTSPYYFNSLKPAEQRNEILKIVNPIENRVVIENNSRLIPLKDILGNKDIEDYIKLNGLKLKDTKKIISDLKPKIEILESLIVSSGGGFDKLKGKKYSDSIEKVKNQLIGYKDKYKEKAKIEKELKELKRQYYLYARSEEYLKTAIVNKNAAIISKKAKEAKLLKEVQVVDKIKKLLDGASSLWKTNFYEGIEDPNINNIFNRDSKNKKTVFEKLKGTQEELSKRLNDHGKIILDLQSSIIDFNRIIDECSYLEKAERKNVEEGKALEGVIKSLEEKLKELNYESEELILFEKLLVLQDKLFKEEVNILEDKFNNKIVLKIEELKDSLEKVKILQADLENEEMLCKEFMLTKVRLIEEELNSKFPNIKFKVYKTQLNGEIVEDFEATLNGVPFSSLNTAARVNCGLEIINVLSEHYNIYAPVFIDNRESVNEIIERKGQVINFIVSRDEVLRVEHTKVNGERLLIDNSSEKLFV